MLALLTGLVLFLGIHSLSIVAPSLRETFARRLGEWPYKGLYSLVAIAGFVLIIQGYGAARLDPLVLYTPPVWMHLVTAVLMLIVFPGLLATYFPGRISAALKHPTLVAVKAWALAHLLSNGQLADVALFGGFLIWAVADRISMKRRSPRPIPHLRASWMNDGIVVIGGMTLYVGFLLWLHPAWIGVPVIP
ncbi:putative membrane protein [Tamilnaduibacter salinus]|uniref:NnrU family protein n=1 Tax=Tamilnaduibacter salinus TaxID=1484056 RepID=A0A2A2I6B6_9GAMM|nr:NnrU family protein [Tamilnaduibacter salinus]PAV26846.1 NnrU family protein [Tamilnaduibacter salinus]PVY77510.1 putative membrane protein [Tamilnaduibacter salinus]